MLPASPAAPASLPEPYHTQFVALLRQGAAARDIHDSGNGFSPAPPSPAFLDRELSRVRLHQRSLVPLLERFAAPHCRVLDFGCSTGGTTVALALSQRLRPRQIVGVDADGLSIKAASVRAEGHGAACHFEQVPAGQPLPFPPASFDLIVCVSVLEFMTAKNRTRWAADVRRVAAPGALVYLSTPNPLRLREYHTRRWLGDCRIRAGQPAAPPPWELRRLFAGCQRLPLGRELFRQRGMRRLSWLGDWLLPLACWQKMLFRLPR